MFELVNKFTLYPEPSQRVVLGRSYPTLHENTIRQSDLFHYSLEVPNITYGKQILHTS
jgi:hypothetical protein